MALNQRGIHSIKAILKDTFSGALSWSRLFHFVYWHLFLAHLDDEISLVQEN